MSRIYGNSIMYIAEHSVVLGVEKRKRFFLSSIALALISFQGTAAAELTPADSLLPNGGFNDTTGVVPRSSLEGFGPSPAGGSFLGFRGSEGVSNTLTIADASEEMTLQFYYTEYNRNRTAPGVAEPDVNIEFRVNSTSSTTGTKVVTVPNLSSSGGTEGTWELLELTFVPADFGVTSAGTIDFFLGAVDSPSNTWAFIDALIVAQTADFVAAENEAPVATNAVASVLANANALVDLSSNVTDADGDSDISTIDLDPSTAGVQKTVSTADGEWSVDAAGALSFDPANVFQGVATIPYVVSDDVGNVSAPASVSVTVAGAAPIATAATATTASGTSVSVPLVGNVSDANGDVDITTIDLDPSTPGIDNSVTTSEGVWAVDSEGVVTFDPVVGFEGVATIPFSVSDGAGNVSAPATVTVTVGSASPVADSESVTTPQGAALSIDVLDGDVDANNDIDPASIDIDPVTSGIQGTFTLPGEGTFSVVGGVVVFEPEPAFVGVSTLEYTVSDNDGNVSNVATAAVEVQRDSDGEDEDSDADGLPDSLEGAVDTDGDESADYRDLDSDNDGIPDAVEGASDTDGDSVPDYLDLDSDSDGIPDRLEAGADPGMPVDTDGDSIADFRDLDSDGDTIVDSLEAGLDPTNPLDTDGDSNPDFLDLDTDNDGASDEAEVGANAAMPQDSDGNGVPDFRQPLVPVAPVTPPVPTTPAVPLDSDEDGIPNSVEGIGDTDGDGSDGDGIQDYLDLDSDNDGLSDALEAGSDAANPVDSDGDGSPDYLDLDSDNDGLADVFESLGATYDNDADGMIDSAEVLDANLDTDGDGIPNRLDIDSDNDGMTDATESGENDLNGDGVLDAYLDSDDDGRCVGSGWIR